MLTAIFSTACPLGHQFIEKRVHWPLLLLQKFLEVGSDGIWDKEEGSGCRGHRIGSRGQAVSQTAQKVAGPGKVTKIGRQGIRRPANGAHHNSCCLYVGHPLGTN